MLFAVYLSTLPV